MEISLEKNDQDTTQEEHYQKEPYSCSII